MEEIKNTDEHIRQAIQMADYYDKEVISLEKQIEEKKVKAMKERLLVIELKKKKNAQ